MKSKVLTTIILFIGAVFLFNLINSVLIQQKISNIRYSYQEIRDFTIIGKTDTDYYLKGKVLMEFKDKIDIKPFDLTYFKDDKPIFINSKKGIYFKEKNLLKLIEDVVIKTKDITMLTETLSIYTQNNTADTKDDVLITGKKMKTYGNGAFIDMNKEEINIYKVKSIFK